MKYDNPSGEGEAYPNLLELTDATELVILETVGFAEAEWLLLSELEDEVDPLVL